MSWESVPERLKSLFHGGRPLIPESLKPKLGIGLAVAAAFLLMFTTVRRSMRSMEAVTGPPPAREEEPAPKEELPRRAQASGFAMVEDGRLAKIPDTPAPKQEEGNRKIVGIVAQEKQKPGSFGYIPPQEAALARQARMRAFIQQLVAIRRNMADADPEPIPISGETARLLAVPPKEGAPIEDRGDRMSWSGAYGGANQAGTHTVSDAQAWRLMWTRLSAKPIPGVDFKHHQIVAVFLGHRPTAGHAVKIKDVDATESNIIVRYEETGPLPGKTPERTPTSPYAMQIIPRSEMPVRFVKER